MPPRFNKNPRFFAGSEALLAIENRTSTVVFGGGLRADILPVGSIIPPVQMQWSVAPDGLRHIRSQPWENDQLDMEHR